MKKILYFLSLMSLLVACTSKDDNSNNLTSEATAGTTLIVPILELSDHIQTSQNDHIEVETVADILSQVDSTKVQVIDNNEFIVELGLSFNKNELKLLKDNLVDKFNIPLTDNNLTSWYLHSSSGKELEISLIETKQKSILRFLMRAYL